MKHALHRIHRHDRQGNIEILSIITCRKCFQKLPQQYMGGLERPAAQVQGAACGEIGEGAES